MKSFVSSYLKGLVLAVLGQVISKAVLGEDCRFQDEATEE